MSEPQKSVIDHVRREHRARTLRALEEVHEVQVAVRQPVAHGLGATEASASGMGMAAAHSLTLAENSFSTVLSAF